MFPDVGGGVIVEAVDGYSDPAAECCCEFRIAVALFSAKMEVAVGDQIIYSKYSGTEVKLEEEKYIIVKQEDILAVIK